MAGLARTSAGSTNQLSLDSFPQLAPRPVPFQLLHGLLLRYTDKRMGINTQDPAKQTGPEASI